ncbi:cysM [Symbiodinium sp. CCMP2592]|nr:cysM [Symbiodinium sp. CCMP2592]
MFCRKATEQSESSESEGIESVLEIPHADLTRQINPEDADLYVDAVFVPLYRSFQSRQHRGLHVKDYLVVMFFLVLNSLIQLGLSYIVVTITTDSYGTLLDKERILSKSMCTKMTSGSPLYGLIWPPDSDTAFGSKYDCAHKPVTLAMNPELLGTKESRYWTIEQAKALDIKMEELGYGATEEGICHVGIYEETLRNMMQYNKEVLHNQGYDDRLDIHFLEQYKDHIRICVASDSSVCGSLVSKGVLNTSYPEKNIKERYHECIRIFKNFCAYIFWGDSYDDYTFYKKRYCGQAKHHFLARGVWTTTYDLVGQYQGDIVTTSFTILLFLVLFIWGMLMLEEYRAINNFWIVIYGTETSDSCHAADFATTGEDGRMEVRKFPKPHKVFALCVCAVRGAIAIAVGTAGVLLLSRSNELLDIILNGTALGFLVEVDNMLHRAFFGLTLERAVTGNCAPLHCDCKDGLHSAMVDCQQFMVCQISVFDALLVLERYAGEYTGKWRPVRYLAVLVVMVAAWEYFVFASDGGLLDLSAAAECLCHTSGERCYGQYLETVGLNSSA